MVREKKNYSGSQNSKSNRLDWILRKFFAELKTEKGQALTPSVLTGIRETIHRHLCPTQPKQTLCKTATSCLSTKCLKRMPSYLRNNAKPKHKLSIQSGDMQKLNRYFMEGRNTDGVWKNAEKLVEFIWFLLCFYFARRGREGWRELTRQSFETKTDDTGACYVRAYDLALDIDNNDNPMTFVGHILYFCPS